MKKKISIIIFFILVPFFYSPFICPMQALKGGKTILKNLGKQAIKTGTTTTTTTGTTAQQPLPPQERPQSRLTKPAKQEIKPEIKVSEPIANTPKLEKQETTGYKPTGGRGQIPFEPLRSTGGLIPSSELTQHISQAIEQGEFVPSTKKSPFSNATLRLQKEGYLRVLMPKEELEKIPEAWQQLFTTKNTKDPSLTSLNKNIFKSNPKDWGYDAYYKANPTDIPQDKVHLDVFITPNSPNMQQVLQLISSWNPPSDLDIKFHDPATTDFTQLFKPTASEIFKEIADSAKEKAELAAKEKRKFEQVVLKRNLLAKRLAKQKEEAEIKNLEEEIFAELDLLRQKQVDTAIDKLTKESEQMEIVIQEVIQAIDQNLENIKQELQKSTEKLKQLQQEEKEILQEQQEVRNKEEEAFIEQKKQHNLAEQELAKEEQKNLQEQETQANKRKLGLEEQQTEAELQYKRALEDLQKEQATAEAQQQIEAKERAKKQKKTLKRLAEQAKAKEAKLTAQIEKEQVAFETFRQEQITKRDALIQELKLKDTEGQTELDAVKQELNQTINENTQAKTEHEQLLAQQKIESIQAQQQLAQQSHAELKTLEQQLTTQLQDIALKKAQFLAEIEARAQEELEKAEQQGIELSEQQKKDVAQRKTKELQRIEAEFTTQEAKIIQDATTEFAELEQKSQFRAENVIKQQAITAAKFATEMAQIEQAEAELAEFNKKERLRAAEAAKEQPLMQEKYTAEMAQIEKAETELAEFKQKEELKLQKLNEQNQLSQTEFTAEMAQIEQDAVTKLAEIEAEKELKLQKLNEQKQLSQAEFAEGKAQIEQEATTELAKIEQQKQLKAAEINKQQETTDTKFAAEMTQIKKDAAAGLAELEAEKELRAEKAAEEKQLMREKYDQEKAEIAQLESEQKKAQENLEKIRADLRLTQEKSQQSAQEITAVEKPVELQAAEKVVYDITKQLDETRADFEKRQEEEQKIEAELITPEKEKKAEEEPLSGAKEKKEEGSGDVEDKEQSQTTKEPEQLSQKEEIRVAPEAIPSPEFPAINKIERPEKTLPFSHEPKIEKELIPQAAETHTTQTSHTAATTGTPLQRPRTHVASIVAKPHLSPLSSSVGGYAGARPTFHGWEHDKPKEEKRPSGEFSPRSGGYGPQDTHKAHDTGQPYISGENYTETTPEEYYSTTQPSSGLQVKLAPAPKKEELLKDTLGIKEPLPEKESQPSPWTPLPKKQWKPAELGPELQPLPELTWFQKFVTWIMEYINKVFGKS